MREDKAAPLAPKSKYRDVFDGAYRAACPACGQDCFWDAFSGDPICECT